MSLPLLRRAPRHSLWKLGHIPCRALWGMAKPHVCSRLGREIKACQEKPGHGGGVGTGRDGMNKRRVQTKSGLLGFIHHQQQSFRSFLMKMQGTMWRRGKNAEPLSLHMVQFPPLTVHMLSKIYLPFSPSYFVWSCTRWRLWFSHAGALDF